MDRRLSSFCVACARFSAGDRLGQLLAVFATAPYFANYHVAVLLHARRELHMVFVFLGLLLTTALSSGIKQALKHPRPAATCALLGNCHKHGMPSSHSAVMAFAAATCVLLYRHRQASRQPTGPGGSESRSHTAAASCTRRLADRMARAVQLIEVQALILLTAMVAYGRVYLGYHTAGQVAAGLALGAGFAAAWWRLTRAVCSSSAAAVLLRLPLLRALHLRNTLGCPDVHAEEAALFVPGQAGRSAPPAADKRPQQHAD